jgi:hypothetical protein
MSYLTQYIESYFVRCLLEVLRVGKIYLWFLINCNCFGGLEREV